jgi:hypothetical protein
MDGNGDITDFKLCRPINVLIIPRPVPRKCRVHGDKPTKNERINQLMRSLFNNDVSTTYVM